MVADLLDDPDFDRSSWPTDGFSHFLIGVAGQHFEGRLSWLARRLGLNKVTVHGWVHKGCRPPLERVVKLAEIFGCPIRSVREGDASHTELRVTAPLSSRRPKSSKIPPELSKRIPKQLRALQRRKKAPSFNQVVREIGVSPHYLRKHYRTACGAIVARLQQQRAAETADRRNRLIQLFRSRVKAIAARGTKLTLGRAMGHDALNLIGLRRQCHQIIAEYTSERRT
jgi:hypothetical protein